MKSRREKLRGKKIKSDFYYFSENKEKNMKTNKSEEIMNEVKCLFTSISYVGRRSAAFKSLFTLNCENFSFHYLFLKRVGSRLRHLLQCQDFFSFDFKL